MKQLITKNTAVFKLICLLAFLGTITAHAQYTAIPDTNFEQALFDLGIDTVNGDQQVLTSAINGVTTLDVSSRNIADLTGIEGFTSLQTLNCQYNQLTSLDVSSNTALTHLNCSDNNLPSINLISNLALTYLNSSANPFTSINVSANTALVELWCLDNQLTSLNVAGLANLRILACGRNQLTTLNLINNFALRRLGCFNNLMTSLNISANTALIDLYCFDNQLTSLDVSTNATLKTLLCNNNQLMSLQFGSNVDIIRLECANNQLTSLDLTTFGAFLVSMLCTYNPNLSCIKVSDPITAAANVNWIKDNNAIYSINCNLPSAPSANTQSFCAGATVANLVGTGTALKWYATATGGTTLANTTILTTGTYYVSQTVGGVESTRTAANVSINEAIITASATTVCSGISVNIAIQSNSISNTEGTAYLEIPENNTGVLRAPAGAIFTSVNFASYGTPSGSLGNYQYQWCNASNSIEVVSSLCLGNNSCVLYSNNGVFGDPCYGTYKRLYVLATYVINNTTYNWSTEETTATINPSPTTTTTYWCDITSNGLTCRKSITITVNPIVTPTFTTVASSCVNATLTALPTTSNNGVSGTWSPALNNTTTTTYTFTPTAGLCANTTIMTITVNPIVTPTFTTVASSCANAALVALPTTSTNGVTGTWSPALNNTTTTTYTFTPTAGQCANTTTQTITITAPKVTSAISFVAPVTIGYFYKGGIIAYVDSSGQHGLIISPSDLGQGTGGCNGNCCAFSTSDGLANTIFSRNNCNVPINSAVICYDLILNGYDDWYLPASGEFQLIYQNTSGLGLLNGTYWTSTETDTNTSYWLNAAGAFNPGSVSSGNRQGGYRNVRAVRAF